MQDSLKTQGMLKSKCQVFKIKLIPSVTALDSLKTNSGKSVHGVNQEKEEL